MDFVSALVEKTLQAERGNVVTIIGSGGKTTLIWQIAADFAKKKVLVSPTTKMLVPKEKLYTWYYDCKSDKPSLESKPGITLAGCYNESKGKLEALPCDLLGKLIAEYDLVLLEGDGANGLPLKAWASYEPVVPSYTSLTIGVLPLWPLGMPISEKIVHRLPLFLELSGASAGEPFGPEHIAAIITGNEKQPGLFAKARGKKFLYFNQ